MINKKSWQRLTLSLIGIALIVATWMQAVSHLYKLPTPALASFTTITVNSQYVIAAIVIFMVTGRLIYEWRVGTTSQIVETGEQITEEIIKRVPAPKHFDEEEIL